MFGVSFSTERGPLIDTRMVFRAKRHARWTRRACGSILFAIARHQPLLPAAKSSLNNLRRSAFQLGSSSRNPRVIQITVLSRELDQIASFGSAPAGPKAARKFGSGEIDHAL